MKIQTLDINPGVLRSVSEHIIKFDKTVTKLVNEMWRTMRWNKAFGLAAPQIGESKRAIVVDTTKKLGRRRGINLLMINPEIEGCFGSEVMYETCLSVPGKEVQINRYTSISVSYCGLDGNEIIGNFNGLNARVIQHEIDHLNGKLIVDYIKDYQKAGVSSGSQYGVNDIPGQMSNVRT